MMPRSSILDARDASGDAAVQHHDLDGRLTLNPLLSFAQFEREVIGERIRDKIRGMSPTSLPAVRYWNMARQRYHRLAAGSYRAPRVSAGPGRSSGAGHPRKTAASRPRKANSYERQVRT